MDEPCSALDPIATAQIEELIFELREEFTIVMVTHSMQQAAGFRIGLPIFILAALWRLARHPRFLPIHNMHLQIVTSPVALARFYVLYQTDVRSQLIWEGTNGKLAAH